MISQIKQLLALPAFADTETARRARLIHTFSLLLFTPVFIAGTIRYLLGAEFCPTMIIYIGLLVLFISEIALVRTGFIRLASHLFPAGLWGLITFGLIASGGSLTPLYSAYILFLIGAGIIHGLRIGLVYTAMSIAVGVGLLYGKSVGWLPPQIITYSPAATLTVYTLEILAAAGLMEAGVYSLRTALTESRRYAGALQKSEANLRKIIGASPGHIFHLTSHGDILEQAGTGEYQSSGVSFFDSIHQPDRVVLEYELKNCFDTGKTRQFEIRCSDTDYYYDVWLAPVKTPSGRTDHLVGNMHLTKIPPPA